ncbi:MAG: histidinol-phosphatase HisJ family protein, partial [Lachnoclostridium sp.]|nr:histidinol-phosphatase HisJ family protein [Lachnoclostridium sp.]
MIRNRVTVDSHVHTDFSSDCKTSMEKMAATAPSLGLTDICLTDHMDYDFPEKYEIPFVFDMEEYGKTIQSLQSYYQPSLTIRTGVELGLQVSAEAKIKALLNHYDFDYVIGSIHIANHMDPYHQEYWEYFESEKKAVLFFFENTLSCLESMDIHFDSLGHLDYIIRYIPSKIYIYYIKEFGDIIDAILFTCIKKDIALEVNTSAYHRLNNNNPHPNKDVLKRYHELGGELLTIGSDAHLPEQLGSHFTECH